MVRMPLPEPCSRAKALDGHAAAGQQDDRGADRMGERRQPRGDQRMEARERAGLEQARRHLRRADQRAGGDRLRGRRAGRLDDARKMRGHAGGDDPGGGEGEGQQDHRTVDRYRHGLAARGAVAGPAVMRGGRGSRQQFIGRAMKRWTAAQARQVSRQPMVEAPQAVSGQPMVLAKPAIRVMPVIAPRASVP